MLTVVTPHEKLLSFEIVTNISFRFGCRMATLSCEISDGEFATGRETLVLGNVDNRTLQGQLVPYLPLLEGVIG